MKVVLPYPPTTNTAYAVRRSRLVKTTKAREYDYNVLAVLAGDKASRAFRSSLRGSERFTVSILVYPPDRRRRDLSNTEKLAVDSVFTFLGADDSAIDRLHLERGEIIKGGKLEVTVGVL